MEPFTSRIFNLRSPEAAGWPGGMNIPSKVAQVAALWMAVAADVVWLATLPRGTRAPQGELVQHRRVLPLEG